jgi:uncharacterized protein YegL
MARNTLTALKAALRHPSLLLALLLAIVGTLAVGLMAGPSMVTHADDATLATTPTPSSTPTTVMTPTATMTTTVPVTPTATMTTTVPVTPTLTPTITPTPTPTLTPTSAAACTTQIELMLVLDGSGSIDRREFNSMRTFARNVANSFTIDSDSARIGIVQFSGSAQYETRLSGDASTVVSTIDGMRRRGGGTYIGEGLQLARTELADSGRPGVPQAIILLTDGRSWGRPAEEATLAKNAGITILAVAVGNGPNINQINAISSDPDSRYVFAVGDFNSLAFILDSLVQESCPPVLTPTPTVTPQQPTITPTPTTPSTALDVSQMEPNEGTTNSSTDVNIIGENFSTSPAPQAVLTNGTDEIALLNIQAPLDTHIEATVPQGMVPGSYDLLITNPDGAQDTLPNAFTVLGDTPLIGSVLPSFGYNDTDNIIYVAGQNFANDAEVSLGTTVMTSTRLNPSTLQVVIPAGQAVGVYDVTVTNPDGTSNTRTNAYTVLSSASNNDLFGYSNELWVNPLVPIEGQQAEIGLFVHRQGGKSALVDVQVEFTEGSPTGPSLGTGTVPFLDPPGSKDSTGPVDVTFSQAGTYTIYATIDPNNLVPEGLSGEQNNVISRTITVRAAGGDAVVPRINSIVINGGANTPVRIPNVTVDIEASDPEPNASGVASINVIEYVYNAGAQQWIPIAQSGWLPYNSTPSTYSWDLQTVPGMHYLQVRAQDNAGNISIGNARQIVNYEPSADQIGRGQTRIYRYTVAQSETLRVDLSVLSGDPDLYVWSSAADQSARVSNQSAGDEQVIVPPNEVVPGVYQVEVYGFTAATYQLLANTNVTTLNLNNYLAEAIERGFAAQNPDKDLPLAPVIPVDSVPSELQGTVPPPVTSNISAQMTLYLPILQR